MTKPTKQNDVKAAIADLWSATDTILEFLVHEVLECHYPGHASPHIGDRVTDRDDIDRTRIELLADAHIFV
jgi:hypothetical protein